MEANAAEETAVAGDEAKAIQSASSPKCNLRKKASGGIALVTKVQESIPEELNLSDDSGLGGDTPKEGLERKRSSLKPQPRRSVAWTPTSAAGGAPKPPPVVEKKANTYRLAPTSAERFRANGQTRSALYQVLDDYLRDRTYDARSAPALCKEIADAARLKAREMHNMPRYKVVASVVIGQDTRQSVAVASRCVWDTSTDSYSDVEYTNGNLYAVLTVFGAYCE